MARRYHRMTPARRAALRKAQAASARKRRRGSVSKRAAKGVGIFAGLVAGRQLQKFADNPFTYVKRTKKEFRETRQEFGNFRSSAARKFRRKKKAGSLNFTIQSGPWV